MEARDNNKGFSLLELLVAVAILAVIVTPFLMAFLTTTRINASTKDQQRARFAATNVVEDIRSKSVEEVLASEGWEKIVDDTSNDDINYYYTRTTKEMSDGVEYTVIANLDPRRNTEAETDEATDYNKDQLVNIYRMSSSKDGFYELGEIADYDKIEQLAERLFSSRDEETLKKVYHSVNREIILTIDQNNDKSVDAKVSTIYSIPNVDPIESTPQIIYTNSLGDLHNLYLFFNPLYNGTRSQARETITVINNTNKECGVYLCRQDWPSVDSERYKTFTLLQDGYCNYGTEAARNNNYKLNVRLSETKRSLSDIFANGDINVLTSIRTNVDDVKSTSPEHLSLAYSYGNSASYDYTVRDLGGSSHNASDIMGLDNITGTGKGQEQVYRLQVKAFVKKDGMKDETIKNIPWTIETTTE